MAVKINMDQRQLVTVAVTIGMCTIVSLEKAAPPHSAFARKAKKVEDAIADLAKLVSSEIDFETSDLGVKAWTLAMNYLAKNIKGTIEEPPIQGGKQ